MNTFEIIGRCHAHPPPADWREQLAARLGSRPRRIGIWAELALYGALECLADAGEEVLPKNAKLLVASHKGPLAATQAVLEQEREGLPMPLTFLQTQPSQMLAVLAAHLGWSGDACFIAARHPHAVLRLAAAQSGAQGVLLGWVDEDGDGSSVWLRLRPCVREEGGFTLAGPEEIISRGVTQLRITPGELLVR